MAFEVTYLLNGIPVRPVNADDIGFKLDWTGDAREAELTTDTIELANEAKRLVLDHIDQFGVYEGIPFEVQIGGLNIEYYIDLTDEPKISGEGDSTIEVTIKRRKAVDWFLNQANALSFEAINVTNPITGFDVPYLIVKDNQAELLITLAISTYSLTKALIEGIQDLTTAVAELIQASTPNTGVPPSIDTGDIIAAAIKVTARTIYVIALTVAIIELTQQIMELLFPPIRKFRGSTVLELMRKGCEKLGFEFSSSILEGQYSALTICGVPTVRATPSIFTTLFSINNGVYNENYPTARDTVSTLGGLIDAMQNVFNSQIRIVGNTVFLERRDFWVQNANTTITNTLNLQDVRENQWTYNTEETWKRYYLHYQLDYSDSHTLDKIEGSDCEYNTDPLTVQNADLVSIKGLFDINIPFALGVRKDSLTVVEQAALPFASLADAVINFFGGNSNLTALVLGRIGVMQISQQYFSTTKLLYCVGGRQPSNYLSLISANKFYTDFHAINQVKENFKRIYSAPVAFSTAQFEALLDNNYILDEQQNSLEIRTFEWFNVSKTAEITYEQLSNEGFNTKTTLING